MTGENSQKSDRQAFLGRREDAQRAPPTPPRRRTRRRRAPRRPNTVACYPTRRVAPRRRRRSRHPRAPRPPRTPLPCSHPPVASAAGWRRSPKTAKAYARSAQADNTRRAYAADWRLFASWLRRQGLPETPPDPEAVGLYLAAASRARRRRARRSPPSSGGCRASHGATASSASRSTSATDISRPCWPASAAGTAALPCRRPRSSPMSFWRCWRRWRWT